MTINREARMRFSPFLSVSHPCDEAMGWIHQRLTEANLRFVQTFDLHEARSGSSGCTCPYHGTEACDCQMVVLLIYGLAHEPVTLVLHGSDGQTWLSLVDTPDGRSNAGLIQAIQQALETSIPEPGIHEEK
ncbi:MAG TPA: hypothetical protein VKB04_14000 [Anaerolineales bacterium]|nr:hypothetical protein [Anaerolineales bacterium]